MGKRKTAKTGDKALYGSREKLANEANGGSRNKDDDDPMYDEVDRFHNDRDENFLRLEEEERGDSDDEDKHLAGNKHSVLDLGAGGTSSEDDDDSSSDDDAGRDNNRKAGEYSSSSEEEEDDVSSSDDDDDDDEELNMKEDPRNWGKKKSLYYHGDTADLEIGQEEEDAYLEEEAAQEIQKSRFEEMDEDDFVLSEDEDGASEKKESDGTKSKSTTHEELTTIRDASKLSKKESRKLLDKQYPELLPMVSYFSDVVKDLKERTDVATKALMEGEGTAESVGATIKGQQYLLTKAMIQKSIALNSVMYILLRYASVGEEDATSNIQAHPVMDHLKKFTTLLEKLEEGVGAKTKDIDLQLDNLVKAAALMANAGEEDDDSSSGGDDKSESAMEMNEERTDAEIEEDKEEDSDQESVDSEEERVAIAQKKQKDYERTLNEARFGLRPNEAKASSKASRKRRTDQMDDFGDLDEDTNVANNLASTMNTIEQRSQTASRKRRPAPMAEDLDDLDEYDDRVTQGIKMMEEEMGKLDGGNLNHDDDNDNDKDMGDDNMDDPDAGDDDELGFYDKIAAKSKDKKKFKKDLYKVAPKFPRVDGEVEGERALSRAILKNRGLVAHKAKINRNPRVKKREQYRKALIRRKGAVREVREAQEGNQYGGEQTGIKSRISRSRKLG